MLGDTLRVMRNTGGGGGHALTVKDFRMTILHKKKREALKAADDRLEDNQEGGEVTPEQTTNTNDKYK